MEDEAEALEKEMTDKNGPAKAAQERCGNPKTKAAESKSFERPNERRGSEGDHCEAPRNTSETLRQALSLAKETDDSLREYIGLLEEDKAMMDKELQDARERAEKELQDARERAEKYARKYDSLNQHVLADAKEQKSAIDSLLDMIEKQEEDHERETSSLKAQLSKLHLKHRADFEEMKKSTEGAMAKLTAANTMLKKDALTLRAELQNALKELAECRHEHRGRTPR